MEGPDRSLYRSLGRPGGVEAKVRRRLPPDLYTGVINKFEMPKHDNSKQSTKVQNPNCPKRKRFEF